MEVLKIEHSISDFDLAVREELKRLLAAREFDHSPIMSHLLLYLTEQTLAGNGKMITAYSVAVDGLGRTPDFDPVVDSYPRVQIGRLRKILESYYAHHPDQPDPCLHIPKGAYRIRLSKREIAYPEIVSHHHGEHLRFITAATVKLDDAVVKGRIDFPLSYWLRLFGVISFSGACLAGLAWLIAEHFSK